MFTKHLSQRPLYYSCQTLNLAQRFARRGGAEGTRVQRAAGLAAPRSRRDLPTQTPTGAGPANAAAVAENVSYVPLLKMIEHEEDAF